MLILRTTDLVPCTINDLTVWVSPLSWADQASLYRFNRMESGEIKVDETQMLFETLRLSVKKVDGFSGHQYADGTNIELQFDDSGHLDAESLECLIRVIGLAPMSTLSSALISNNLNEKLRGWEIKFDKIESTKKKSWFSRVQSAISTL